MWKTVGTDSFPFWANPNDDFAVDTKVHIINSSKSYLNSDGLRLMEYDGDMWKDMGLLHPTLVYESNVNDFDIGKNGGYQC